MRKPAHWKAPDGKIRPALALRFVVEIEHDFAALGIIERRQELVRGGDDFCRRQTALGKCIQATPRGKQHQSRRENSFIDHLRHIFFTKDGFPRQTKPHFPSQVLLTLIRVYAVVQLTFGRGR